MFACCFIRRIENIALLIYDHSVRLDLSIWLVTVVIENETQK